MLIYIFIYKQKRFHQEEYFSKYLHYWLQALQTVLKLPGCRNLELNTSINIISHICKFWGLAKRGGGARERRSPPQLYCLNPVRYWGGVRKEAVRSHVIIICVCSSKTRVRKRESSFPSSEIQNFPGEHAPGPPLVVRGFATQCSPLPGSLISGNS